MDNIGLESAILWLPYIETVKILAEAGVVFCLAIGLAAALIGAPLSKKIENARELQILQLKAEIEDSKKQIAISNAETAKAKLELAKLQPRIITQEQHDKIVELLKNEPKGSVIVVWKQFDEESINFGKQILNVLKDAGYDAKESIGPMTFGIAGTWIVVRDLNKLLKEPSYAGSIQATLRNVLNINFDGQQRKDPFPDLGEVVIAIGSHP